jgi:hypothetical protein
MGLARMTNDQCDGADWASEVVSEQNRPHDINKRRRERAIAVNDLLQSDLTARSRRARCTRLATSGGRSRANDTGRALRFGNPKN